jgi:transposase
MEKIRDIIRLRLTTELSDRQIGRALKVSRTVVAKTIVQWRSSGLDAREIAGMSDSALEQALWRKDRVVDTLRYRQLEKRFPAMLQELKKRGMTLEWLWKQYIEEHPGGYRYSQFCLHFQRWSAAGELWMHQEHKAGECMYADWAGEPLVVLNANTGAQWPVPIYVGILGASGLTWVQGSESQEQPWWIRSNEGALRYFGGHPEALIPDNLKTGVQKADRYEPQINPVFEEFARYYEMAILPARVRKPRDKALCRKCCKPGLPAHLHPSARQALQEPRRAERGDPRTRCLQQGALSPSIRKGRPLPAPGNTAPSAAPAHPAPADRVCRSWPGTDRPLAPAARG